MRAAVTELASTGGVAAACRLLGVPRASYYRSLPPSEPRPALPPAPSRPARVSVRALSSAERAQILDLLRSARFVDQSPREIYATLLDEGIYHCSWPTMYRLLRQTGEVQRRRDQARQRTYARPELLATAPKQLWSWDITKLRGPTAGSYYFLYVMIDVFSRYVVGWMLTTREGGDLAEAFLAETCTKEGIVPDQLTIHADRGSPMTAQCVADLLTDLGVRKSHSRPHVSDDNPYSEAHFKTVKYHSSFPDRFGSREDAQSWARTFFAWYNQEHHHSGLGLMTPAMVHQGQATAVASARQKVLTQAYTTHPERFMRGEPTPPTLPEMVWINPPLGATPPSVVAPADGTARSGPAGAVGSRETSAAALDATPPVGNACAARPPATSDPVG
jgi:putative transposase